jgi:hypothetical protein
MPRVCEVLQSVERLRQSRIGKGAVALQARNR